MKCKYVHAFYIHYTSALNKVVLELRDTTATLATENVTLRKENEELKLCLHENEQVIL